MQLTPRRHELLSVYLLGAGTLFMYIGYVTQSFISEPIIRGMSAEKPGTISEFAGYYGQAFHYTAFAISSLVTPSIQAYIKSKWILTTASALFAIYYLGFMHFNTFYFYIAQVLMGIGYSFYNNGEGAYLSEHSSRRTIESNTGIETAVGHSSLFVGGLALLTIFYFVPQDTTQVTNISRTFSEFEIRIIYGTFFALNVISMLIFALLPTKQYDSIASKSQVVLPSLQQQISGVFLRKLVKQCQKWRLPFIITIHLLFIITGLVLVQLSVPEMATIRPTTEVSPQLIHPSRLIVGLIGFLFGVGDFSITMARAVICQVVVPECRMQVFSISRLYQCLSSCIVLVLTPYMAITCWTITLFVGLVLGTSTFIIVARRTDKHQTDIITAHSKIELTTTELA
uniref:MFS domain-containing protein n=1 Tax=Heterorhabditis bacteriophora TaxID=37862 RepID=A0A1I7XKC2_HETBA